MSAKHRKHISLVLASQSPRRKQLLELLDLPFSTQVSDVKEFFDKNEAPRKIVQSLACQKAKEVSSNHPYTLTIGADTLVVLNNEILEKPDNKTEARSMLGKLSGNTHRVLTGVALILTDESKNITQKETFYEETLVTFGKIDSAQIEKYIKTGQPMDKAGGYGIQDKWGAIFVECIDGDFYNVVGLPLHVLFQRLKTFTPGILNF